MMDGTLLPSMFKMYCFLVLGASLFMRYISALFLLYSSPIFVYKRFVRGSLMGLFILGGHLRTGYGIAPPQCATAPSVRHGPPSSCKSGTRQLRRSAY